MNTATATALTASIDKIVAACGSLITAEEAVMLRSSLLIDLDLNPEAIDRAIGRALRSIESHRLGYRSSLSGAEVANLAALKSALQVAAQATVERSARGMYSATANAPERHAGQHLQGCVACIAAVEAATPAAPTAVLVRTGGNIATLQVTPTPVDGRVAGRAINAALAAAGMEREGSLGKPLGPGRYQVAFRSLP